MNNNPRGAAQLHVRRLERAEGLLLRRLRIEALRDSPEQFGETIAQALIRADAEWLKLAASAYVAEVDDALVGLVLAFDDKSDATIARLGGLWVAPGVRRAGIGAALVEAVVSWARASNKRCVRLFVVPETPAERFYRGAHFVATGGQDTLPHDDSRTIIELELELNEA